MNRSRLRELMVRRGVVSILVWVLVALLLLFLSMALIALLCGDDFLTAIVTEFTEAIERYSK